MYVVSNMQLTYKADVWRTSPLKRVGHGYDFFIMYWSILSQLSNIAFPNPPLVA